MSKSPSKAPHKPHHMHALDKASAKHLLNAGHIDQDKHDEIVAHAERGMARARRNRDRGETAR
jgi:hypothetical protein